MINVFHLGTLIWSCSDQKEMPNLAYRLVLLVVILLIVFDVSTAGGQVDEGAFASHVRQIKQQIQRLQSVSSSNPSQIAQLYLQLGIIYQQHDLIKHTGGDLQRKAVDAFDSAISFDGGAHPPIIVTTLYQKGILMRMMSLGQVYLSSCSLQCSES